MPGKSPTPDWRRIWGTTNQVDGAVASLPVTRARGPASREEARHSSDTSRPTRYSRIWTGCWPRPKKGQSRLMAYRVRHSQAAHEDRRRLFGLPSAPRCTKLTPHNTNISSGRSPCMGGFRVPNRKTRGKPRVLDSVHPRTLSRFCCFEKRKKKAAIPGERGSYNFTGGPWPSSEVEPPSAASL